MTQYLLHLLDTNYLKNIFWEILFALVVMSCPVHGSLQITDYEYPLMLYTKLISQEHFIAGRPLAIVLPPAEEDLPNKEVDYLVEELHTSGRWPILVINVTYKMNENMYTEIQQHGSYIILISGPCKDWEKYDSVLWQQLIELSTDDNIWLSFNRRAKFIVSVMSNCTHSDNMHISKVVLDKLWMFEVSYAIVLFLKSNELGGNNLQQDTSDSAQDTYLELHTWYPFENSDRCNPAEGTVPVKVFTVRNLSDIRRRDIFREYVGRNMFGCRLYVQVEIKPPSVFPPKRVWYNDSVYHDIYEDGIEIELLGIIANSLNMTLDIDDITRTDYRSVTPTLFVGRYATYSSALDLLTEQSRGYLNTRLDWYTPCAVKYQRWSRFFNIFSVNMWICFVLSLVLAVITVRCISYYGQKLLLHESTSYSNIFSVTANVIAVSLSVSVTIPPRSAPLRLFFFCWVCYSVAISTVFQAYLTTFLIDPGYEEPIKTVEQMIKSERKFGFIDEYEIFFENISGSVDSAILETAVQFPDRGTSFIWAAAYQNLSVIFDNLNIEIFRDMGKLTDENKKPLLCELEDGGVTNMELVILVIRGNPLFEFINNIIQHTVESGILTQTKKRDFPKEKILPLNYDFALDDTYTEFGVGHLQTAFYLLILGYVSALVCFVIEIMWHRYRSKGSETRSYISVSRIHTHRSR